MTPAQRPRPARSTRGTMTLPALWRDLRREFEQLPDPGLLEASAPRRLKASGGEIVGGTASLRFQFTQFAQRGGMLLGASRKTAVATWLRRLQADLTQGQNPSLLDMRITTAKYRASAPHARIVTVTEWEIDRVSAASVDTCIALETRARQRRPTTRHTATGAAAPPPPVAATAFDLAQKGNYAFWKIEDVAAHEPKSLEEPGMKEMATQAWRLYKARPAVEKRAQELADIVTKSDKPMAEALSEQTVTGVEKEKGIFVTVKSTGDFSWLQRSMTPNQFNQDNSPRFGTIQGVEKANEKFMENVFNEMQPGGTAVVPNADRSIYYVVHIDKRTPSTEAEIAVMQKQFLESQGELSRYADGMSRSNDGSYVDRLFVKHGVKMSLPEGRSEDE